MKVILILLIIACLSAWFYSRSKSNNQDKKPSTQPIKADVQTAPPSPYRSVKIVPQQPCCNAALGVSKRFFLLSDAPKLPLSNCDQAQTCKCKYARYADRRSSTRRYNVYAAKEVAMGHTPRTNHRKSRGRRKGEDFV